MPPALTPSVVVMLPCPRFPEHRYRPIRSLVPERFRGGCSFGAGANPPASPARVSDWAAHALGRGASQSALYLSSMAQRVGHCFGSENFGKPINGKTVGHPGNIIGNMPVRARCIARQARCPVAAHQLRLVGIGTK